MDYEKDLTVLIMGSSRPELWPIMWESFEKMCFSRRKKYVIVHEDVVIPEQSSKVGKYVNLLMREKKVREYHESNPKVGLGPAMDVMFKNFVKTKYMFYIQEDWEFERPIDIDEILFAMDMEPKLNLVFFNKYKNFPTLNGLSQEEVCHTGMWTCLFHGWTFLPGIWRMDFVKKHWRTREVRPEGYFTQAFEGRDDNEWCKENLGAYIYGKQNDWRYVRHLGDSWRMADWRLENGQPGGMIEPSKYSKAFKAPWLPEILRPENENLVFDEEKFNKVLSEEPVEVQNILKTI